MKGFDEGGIGEPLDKPGELHFKFIVRFDEEIPLADLYEDSLLLAVEKHQTKFFLSVSDVNFETVSFGSEYEQLRKAFRQELQK